MKWVAPFSGWPYRFVAGTYRLNREVRWRDRFSPCASTCLRTGCRLHGQVKARAPERLKWRELELKIQHRLPLLQMRFSAWAIRRRTFSHGHNRPHTRRECLSPFDAFQTYDWAHCELEDLSQPDGCTFVCNTHLLALPSLPEYEN